MRDRGQAGRQACSKQLRGDVQILCSFTLRGGSPSRILAPVRCILKALSTRDKGWESGSRVERSGTCTLCVCVCMCIFNSKSYSCKASLHVFNKLDTSSQGAHMYSFSYTRSHGHFLSDKASKYVLWAASFSDHTWESAWLAVCLENIICMQSHMCMYMLEDGAVKGILYSFPFLC